MHVILGSKKMIHLGIIKVVNIYNIEIVTVVHTHKFRNY